MADITEKEAAIYDRQMRLWGVDAQRALCASKVLVSGLNALGAEVCKDLVLAGVNVTVQDDAVVTPSSVAVNFFLEAGDVGSNRAAAMERRVAAMNPLVKVTASTSPISSFTPADFASYTLVILCASSPAEQLTVAAKVREARVPLIAATLAGTWGGFFSDLLEFSYQHTTKTAGAKEDEEAAVTTEVRTLSFPPLAAVATAPAPKPTKAKFLEFHGGVLAWQAMMRVAAGGHAVTVEAVTAAAAAAAAEAGNPPSSVPAAAIAAWVGAAGVEVVPVAAIVGGVIGQEAVKIATRRDAPVDNVFVYDGLGGSGGVVVRVGGGAGSA